MTDKTTSAIDLVERVARAIYEQQFPGSAWPESADRADAWRDMARAAIEAQSDTITRLQAALEWQPIETAPRDGTWVLSWCARDGHGLARCMGYTSLTDDENWSGATHWMPLPEPPALSSVGGAA